MEKKIFFDVGANSGKDSIPIAKNDVNTIVFGFEPTPQLIGIIKNQISGLNNYILIEKAVSNYNGKSKFNVAGQADWGCSSLLEFSDKSKTEWCGRTDFRITEEIEVDVIRLDNFIEEFKIKKIDYLHVDTQGSDLNVLKGLGDYLKIVNEGVIEAANKENILYFGQNTKEECIDFLVKNNFKIINVEKNDPHDNEINIYFKNNEKI